MPNELGTRDVVEQLDTRLGNLEQGQRDLRTQMSAGFSELRGEMREGRSELRGEMDRRFGRMNGMMVSVLLAVVVGIGGLWLK
jgi:hypothetical protein